MGNGFWKFSIWIAVAALAGCASSKEDPGPSVTLELSSQTVAARLGDSGALSVALVRADLADEVIEVSFEGLPEGASGRPAYLTEYAAKRGKLELVSGPGARTGVTSAYVVARVGEREAFRTSVRVVLHDWGSAAEESDGVVSIPPFPNNLNLAYPIAAFLGVWSPHVDRGLLVRAGDYTVGSELSLVPFREDEKRGIPPELPSPLRSASDLSAAWTDSELYVAGRKYGCERNCLTVASFDPEGNAIWSRGEEDETYLEGFDRFVLDDVTAVGNGVSLLSWSEGRYALATFDRAGKSKDIVRSLEEPSSIERRAFFVEDGIVSVNFGPGYREPGKTTIRRYSSSLKPVRFPDGTDSLGVEGLRYHHVAGMSGGFLTCGEVREKDGRPLPLVQRWRSNGTADLTFGSNQDGSVLLFGVRDPRYGTCRKVIVTGNRIVALVEAYGGYSLVILRFDGERDPAFGNAGEIRFPWAAGVPALSPGLYGEAIFAFSSGSYGWTERGYGTEIHKIFF